MNTRSGSNAQNITLEDIKTLIDSVKSELKCEIQKINDKIEILFERVIETDAKVKDLDDRCLRLETRVKCIEEARACGADHEEFLQEAEERHRRRKFLIVSGLPEHASGSLNERKQKDALSAKALVANTGIDDFEPEEVVRIGSIHPSRPRLLRIKCKSRTIRNSILKGARRLRSSDEFKNVFVNADQTLMQRKNYKNLRAELFSRRMAGEDVVLYRGRIVQKNFS